MSEPQKIEPLSAEALEHYRSEHGPMGDLDPDLCKFPTCYHWPCDYGTWLATIDAERERADAAVESLRWVVDHRGLVWPVERAAEIEAVIGPEPTNHDLCPPRICPRSRLPVDKEPSRE